MKQCLQVPWTKEQREAWDRQYYSENREQILAKLLAKRMADRDGFNARARQIRARNPDKARARDKKYREQPIVKVKRAAYRRKYYLAHKESENDSSRQYMRVHPEKNRNNQHKRRQQMVSEGDESKRCEAFILLIRSKKWVRCYYCDRKVRGKDAHIDHVFALRATAAPGSHAVHNLCASCPYCNRSKRHRSLSEWKSPLTNQPVLNL